MIFGTSKRLKNAKGFWKTPFTTPTIVFSCIINLNLCETQLNRLLSLNRRAKAVTRIYSLRPIYKTIQRNTCNIVRIYIDGRMCSSFYNVLYLLQSWKVNTKQHSFAETINSTVADGQIWFLLYWCSHI